MGGNSASTLASVEVLTTSGTPLPCTVPPLPLYRSDHTQDGEVACGGSGGPSTCVSLTASGWTTSHQLQQSWYDHVSWRSPDGLLLMGPITTELLTDTGSSSLPSWILEYDTQ